MLAHAGFAGFAGTGTIGVDNVGDREATVLGLGILNSPGTIRLECLGGNGPNFSAAFATITAIKVDSVAFDD
ncbi:MAG: hypothetical protein ACRDJ4_00770 [Actinomycetota bacterium]